MIIIDHQIKSSTLSEKFNNHYVNNHYVNNHYLNNQYVIKELRYGGSQNK